MCVTAMINHKSYLSRSSNIHVWSFVYRGYSFALCMYVHTWTDAWPATYRSYQKTDQCTSCKFTFLGMPFWQVFFVDFESSKKYHWYTNVVSQFEIIKWFSFCFSKKREVVPDLAPMLWHSFGKLKIYGRVIPCY